MLIGKVGIFFTVCLYRSARRGQRFLRLRLFHRKVAPLVAVALRQAFAHTARNRRAQMFAPDSKPACFARLADSFAATIARLVFAVRSSAFAAGTASAIAEEVAAVAKRIRQGCSYRKENVATRLPRLADLHSPLLKARFLIFSFADLYKY